MIYASEDIETYLINCDLWSSLDGIYWSQLNSAAIFPEGDVYKAVTFCDRIFIVGGQQNVGVWFTKDGIDWEQGPANSQVGSFGVDSAISFKDYIWYIGHAVGTSNNSPNVICNIR